ncbi:XRE family transcriptional regulator [Ktedonosporobacter rubrisoli]|uniref:XRE family transcriptional regulator n=1 Tax=Ktedonosporobacter rubrisoli TaxID=2509675 RepID=A0A4P6JZN4_KTERU|nr:helix-turn-helix transcriptional regulator [Ktedonosporobacter rubrisoli]QBD81095.1 XRE family transcriptional regulator [Ktedonosporobacter rubrisoli]
MALSPQQPDRRAELADFLRTRRARLAPRDVGLPEGSRRRLAGLRREEVALLAGVGITWYTWLEQGRDVQASSETLENLAHALRLDGKEREYLFLLADRPLPDKRPSHGKVNSELQRMVEHLEPNPAYILGPRWDILAWNRAASLVFTDFGQLPEERRNLLWWYFTDPVARQRFSVWENYARCWLGQFRISWGRYAGEPDFVELVEDLKHHSSEFRSWWPMHEIYGRYQGRKEIEHPLVGRLVLENAMFRVEETPGVSLALYVPLPEEETAAKLQRLLESA